MHSSRRQGRIVAAAVFGAVATLALVRLSSYGIWDPWELASADLARQLAAGEVDSLQRPPLVVWLVSRGFALFGVHEWSGRLPMALGGLAAVGIAYALVARFVSRRAAIWAAVAAGTTPLFLLNARHMLGAAPAFATSGAVFLCAMAAVFAPARLLAPSRRRRALRIAWLLGLLVSAVLATLASGVLLGVAPPLLAAAVAVVARGEVRPPWADRERGIVALIVLAGGVIAAGGAAHALWADYAGFGLWTGGVPRGGDPPTWEVAVEHVFHSFAPWSALLPLALARMLVGAPRPDAAASHDGRLTPVRRDPIVRHPEEDALRLGLLAWVAFGFAAQTLYEARLGPAAFLPLVAAAAAVAIMLHDVERSRQGWWGAAVVVFLFVGLLVRDFRAYPSGPIEGLPVEGIEVPEVFNPRVKWAAVLGLFGLLMALGLAADPAAPFRQLRRDLATIASDARGERGPRARMFASAFRLGVPVQLIVEQWRRGPGFKVWLVLLGALVATITLAGAAFWVAPDQTAAAVGGTSLAIRIGKAVALVVPGVVVLVAVARLALFGFAKLGSHRLVPGIVAALAVGGYAVTDFQSELSSHFSPREVYDTYNDLAEPSEPLGEFRVGGRAAAYYATGEIRELASQAQLIDFLQSDERVWVAFRGDDLASIDREYRRRAGRHLFVADARSARMVLATNQSVEGVQNQNYLADAILDEAPSPQHRVHIDFDRRVELLGYDLGLPHGSYVGPGESFTITWYFRVVAPVPGGYKPFVHIDGPGMRINGDHEPVEGHYPVRLWEPGDIIVDRHELRVPANYRRGDLTIYMGFYSGDQRLEVVEGPEDDVDRARVGTLPIR